MAESMNPEELTLPEEIKKGGEKNTLLLTARRLKSHQVCGHLKIILGTRVVKRLRNVTHFTIIKISL